MRLSRSYFAVFGLILIGLTISSYFLIKNKLKSTNGSVYNLGQTVSFLAAKNSACSQARERNRCYDQTAKEIIKKVPFKNILLGYSLIQDQNQQFSCHDIMHFIASNAYQVTKNLPELFNQCSSVCFNACYHGAVLGFITNSNLAGADTSQLTDTVIHACDSLTNIDKPNFINSCIHGVGHSLMLISDNNLPQSLSLCNSFKEESKQETCYGGVFMENFPNSSSSDHPSKYLSKTDPLYPCNSLDRKYLNSCYTFIGDYLSFLSNYDLKKTVTLCDVVPQPYRNNCYTAVGTRFVGNAATLGVKLKVCDIITQDEPKQYCIKGAVISYADRFGGDNEQMFKMFDFCALVAMPYKEACYKQVGRNLKQWVLNIKDREAACLGIKEDDYQKLCLNPD